MIVNKERYFANNKSSGSDFGKEGNLNIQMGFVNFWGHLAHVKILGDSWSK